MSKTYIFFTGLIPIAAIIFSGCATAPEVEKTIDLVTTHSQKLNKQLKGFDKNNKEISKLREDRIARMEVKAKDLEAKASEIVRIWELGKNKSALEIFKTLKKTRPKITNIDLGKSKVSAKGEKKALYDPKPIENMGKKLKEIKDGKSFWEQVGMVFGFVGDIGEAVKKNQEKANKTVAEGEEKAKEANK